MSMVNEEYFTAFVTDMNKMGYVLLGKFTATNKKYTYHVGWYSDARHTVFIFALPNRPLLMTMTLCENIYTESGKYESHWSIRLDFRTENVAAFNKMMITVEESDCGETYTGYKFPLVAGFKHSGFSSWGGGGKEHTFNFENVYSMLPQAEIAIAAHVLSVVDKGLSTDKWKTFCVDLLSPDYCFKNCVEDWRREIVNAIDWTPYIEKVISYNFIRN